MGVDCEGVWPSIGVTSLEMDQIGLGFFTLNPWSEGIHQIEGESAGLHTDNNISLCRECQSYSTFCRDIAKMISASRQY